MSIEMLLERIANALEQLAGPGRCVAAATPVVEAPKRTRASKTAPAVVDEIPGVEEATPAVANDVMGAEESPVKTGAELRTLAQSFIQGADKSDPGGKNGTVNKLVTFIQSVAKIFNPGEPKLIKIPDAKVPEAAKMIADWCFKNHIKVV